MTTNNDKASKLWSLSLAGLAFVGVTGLVAQQASAQNTETDAGPELDTGVSSAKYSEDQLREYKAQLDAEAEILREYRLALAKEAKKLRKLAQASKQNSESKTSQGGGAPRSGAGAPSTKAQGGENRTPSAGDSIPAVPDPPAAVEPPPVAPPPEPAPDGNTRWS